MIDAPFKFIPTQAISVRAPWWWAILYAGKDVENRDWKPHNPGRRFRGRVWIHASATRKVGEEREAWSSIAAVVGKETWLEAVKRCHPIAAEQHRGAIVGSVEIVGWIDEEGQKPSIWFFGPGALQLREPIALEKPISCKGELGFFHLAPYLVEQLRNAA